MNNDNINDYVPSLLNPRGVKKQTGDISLTQNSLASRCSLSLRRNSGFPKPKGFIKKKTSINKENSQNENNLIIDTAPKKITKLRNNDDTCSLGYSAIEDLNTVNNNLSLNLRSPISFKELDLIENHIETDKDNKINESLITVSSATELNDTIAYDYLDKTVVSVSFGINDCKGVDISSSTSRIKRISVIQANCVTNVDCDIVESSLVSTEADVDENMNEASLQKRKMVAVNLEIKKKKLSPTDKQEENSKVLILNTNAIEKISHVIVQPPNYKLVKQQNSYKNKFQRAKRKSVFEGVVENGSGVKLSQKLIDSFFPKCNNISNLVKVCKGRTLEKSLECNSQIDNVVRDEVEMSKNSSVADALKFECGRSSNQGNWKDNEALPRSARVATSKRDNHSPKRSDIKMSEAPSSKCRNNSASSHSPRIKVDSVQFSLPGRSKSNRTSITPRNIPHHKIVAGTHFAVDAFSYGDIPNVKHYFLTHFHSDHYSGLKKTFSKFLFCSKITADLCISRLGVSPKNIHVINVDQTIRIDDVEVTAVEANHCPGAIMLVFTLPNGKTLLHTGDFRASPTMESYPVFWNKDIHTIYLDTTYCNPRYDFPTQDQSLEMALYILRQKKMELEKAGKKFTSVLIVCGTYTIGKEKFFLGMAHRVGCAVWACPEKDRVLQTVEGRSFSHAPPHSCQLHVVPMRDLTHEKLRSYLDSLQGAFSEVVAFKPSGWEIGKNTSVETNLVTIHGIPYSEHSSFSEIIRFVKYLKPKQVVPTVDISGGVKAVQKYFPCPLVYKEDLQCQSKVTDYFSIHNRQQVPAVT